MAIYGASPDRAPRMLPASMLFDFRQSLTNLFQAFDRLQSLLDDTQDDFQANSFVSTNTPGSADGTEKALRELKVFVADDCNLNCPFCFSRTPELPAATVNQFRQLFLQAAETGYERVLLSGGEPTLNPDLVKIVRAAADAGMKSVGLETNAILLERPGFARDLSSAGLSIALVSLHSLDQDTLTAMTGGKGTLPRILSGIQHLLEEPDVTVNINIVTTALNYRQLPDMARFLSSTGRKVEQVVISFMAGLGGAASHPELYPPISDAAPLMATAIDILKQAGIDAVIPGQCGVPQCILPDNLDSFSNQRVAAAMPEWRAPHLEDKIFARSCDRCAARPWCYGVWKVYADRYGTDEFKPMDMI